MTPSRTVLVTLLALLGVFGLVTPAWAHAQLESSSPARGAALDAAPSEVTLTFNEQVTLAGTPVTVTGPEGARWSVGEATVSGTTVRAPVTPSGPAGAYTLSWTVVSADGDPVSGTVPFTLTVQAAPPVAESSAPAALPAPAPAPGADPASNDSGGGAPTWVWVLLGVIALAGAGLAVLRNARRGVR